MFDASIYKKRRIELAKKVGYGLVLILGNDESPMDYPGNNYPFIQDCSFLYYAGCDLPGLALIIDLDENEEFLIGNDFTVDDEIWMGPQPSIKEKGLQSGIDKTFDSSYLEYKIKEAISKRRKVHYLPASNYQKLIKLENLFEIHNSKVNKRASVDLIKAVVEQRSIKESFEIEEIEKALDISYEMYSVLMKEATPGVKEQTLVSKVESIISEHKSYISFPTILTINGKTLHNHIHDNYLKEGSLLLMDSGAKSPMYYASDITRTIPVGGKFSTKQKNIYDIVLESQLTAIKAIREDITYKEIHLKAAEVMVDGLKNLGIMKGSTLDAVNEGAHALFFPHGLGHMLGLNAHDMEDLGEQYVGYDEDITRSSQFGLVNLRLGRKLKKGFVVTVEPGLYFIPMLIDLWKSENKHASFINYDKVNEYRDFEGIRIEDDVLVTNTGSKVLGRKFIPKTTEEIEKVMEK